MARMPIATQNLLKARLVAQAGALLDLYATGGAKLADLKAAAINIDAVQRATSVQATVAAAWAVVRNGG